MILDRHPDLVMLVGDLVEACGEQRDWDQFGRHNAGEYSSLASSIPLIPSLDNHENYAGPGGGYETGDGLRGPAVGLDNPFHQFLAYENCPEVWRAGKPLSGSRHYRHLEVNVHPATNGRWQADIVPVYAFPDSGTFVACPTSSRSILTHTLSG